MHAAVNRSPYRRILGYLRPHRSLFIIAVVCMVFFGATDGGVPFLIKELLDGIFQSRDADLLYLLPVIVVAFSVLRALLDFAQSFLMAKVGHLIVRDIRNELNRHLLTLPPSFFARQSSGDLLTRITSDVLLVRTLLTDSLASVIRDSIRIVALLAAAIYLDPFLAGMAAIVLPVGVYPMYRFGKRMRKLSRRGQEAIGALSALFQESVLGNRVVKLFGRERFEQERFEARNDELSRTFLSSERVRAMSGPVNEVLASIAIAAVMLYGGMSVLSEQRTQGDFIAFLIAIFLMYDPFKKLSKINPTVQQGIAGAERIFQLLDVRSEIVEAVPARPMPNSSTITFENVSFKYPPRGSEGTDDRFAVRGISLEIKEGSQVALVGFSGSGKSTLVDLVPRFIDPTEGVVALGGTDLRLLPLSELRARIAVVSQQTFLFNDTIRNNIAYGNPTATTEDIERATRAAFLYDFIRELPHGFETRVGEGGVSLSGGERQRVSIARAILKNAPILILDEATASLDSRAEREVQDALEKLASKRTSIVIAHRLSTIQRSDLIVVMREGMIVERGTHAELLASQGEYARLHRLQFEGQAA